MSFADFVYQLHSRQGVEPSLPHGYSYELLNGKWHILHRKSRVRVRALPLGLNAAAGQNHDRDVVVLFLYTDDEWFSVVEGSDNAWEEVLELAANNDYPFLGEGIYATAQSPDEFGSKSRILLNNHSNGDGDERQNEVMPYIQSASCCIPLVVPRANASDVQIECTAEMVRGPGCDIFGRPLRPDRDLWVIDAAGLDGPHHHDSMEATMDRLSRGNPNRRRLALHELAQSAASGDSTAVAAAGASLESDAAWPVRQQAAWTLAKLAPRGDPWAVEVMCAACIQDEQSDVRSAALEALVQVAALGDHGVVDVAAQCLEDPHVDVRGAAVEALGLLATPGARFAAEAIAKRLGHRSPLVRLAALVAMHRVAGEASEERSADVVRAVDSRLDTGDWRTRAMAVHALGRPARTMERRSASGHVAVVESIAARLEDPDATVRRAALAAIGTAAPRGNTVAVAAVLPRLRHEDAEVRQAALAAAGRLVDAGDGASSEEVARLLEEDDRDTRLAAVEALQKIARANAVSVAAVLPRFRHQKKDVREAARAAAGSFLDAIDGASADIVVSLSNELDDGKDLLERLYHKDADIRSAALAKARRLVDAGTGLSKESIASLLGERNKGLRIAADDALHKISAAHYKGGNKLLSCVFPRLEHQFEIVRRAGVETAVSLAQPGDMQVPFLAARLLAHDSMDVRRSATEVIRRTAPSSKADQIVADPSCFASVLETTQKPISKSRSGKLRFGSTQSISRSDVSGTRT